LRFCSMQCGRRHAFAPTKDSSRLRRGGLRENTDCLIHILARLEVLPVDSQPTYKCSDRWIGEGNDRKKQMLVSHGGTCDGLPCVNLSLGYGVRNSNTASRYRGWDLQRLTESCGELFGRNDLCRWSTIYPLCLI